jgi:hypothetical protein
MMDADAPVDRPAMGFAGLASLVSTVADTAPAWTPSGDGGQVTFRTRVPPRRQRMAVGSVATVVGGVMLVFSIASEVTRPQRPAPYVVRTAPKSWPTLQRFTQGPVWLEAPGPPAAPAAPSSAPPPPSSLPGVSEVKPPPGTDLALSVAQIRYCVAQKVRLDIMEPIVDLASSAQVRGFNGLVDDYNLRCLSYRYRRTVMDLVQSDVQALRPALEAQARAQVAAWH